MVILNGNNSLANLESVRPGSVMSLQGLNIGFVKLASKWAQDSHFTLSSRSMHTSSRINSRPCPHRATSLNLLPLRCSMGAASELHPDHAHVSVEHDTWTQVSSFTSPCIKFLQTECDSRIPTCGSGFILPPIRCSFPTKLHPQCETIRMVCEPWILNLARPGSEQLILDCLIPRYVCRLFPEATDLRDLETITNFIAWLFLSDDIEDTGPLLLGTEGHGFMGSHDHGPPSTTNVWAQSVLSKLRDPQSPINVVLFDNSSDCRAQSLIMLDALGELWGKMSSRLVPQARSRFISVMQDHLHAVCLQPTSKRAFWRHEEGGDMNKNVEEYRAIRRHSSGFLVGFELVLYVLGLDEDPIHLHPLVEEFRDLVLDYIWMCNDIVSCHMEASLGYNFNLPWVVYESGAFGSFQDSVEVVVGMMNSVDARCAQVVDAIQRNEELIRKEPKLNAYLATMVSWMSGTLCWSFETYRYGLKHDNEHHKHTISC